MVFTCLKNVLLKLKKVVEEEKYDKTACLIYINVLLNTEPWVIIYVICIPLTGKNRNDRIRLKPKPVKI